MPRNTRSIQPLPERTLENAASDFVSCALKALEGQVPNQSELARRLGWPETTLSSALKGRFTFRSWPKICKALGKDPIEELARGRSELRKQETAARENAYRTMLERAEADAMVSFWKKLPADEKERVLDLLNSDADGASGT